MLLLSKKELIKGIKSMNETVGMKEILIDFVINGIKIKGGVIKTIGDYRKHSKNIAPIQKKTEEIEKLLFKAKNNTSPTQLYKEISLVQAMVFFYPLELVDAIHKMKVITQRKEK